MYLIIYIANALCYGFAMLIIKAFHFRHKLRFYSRYFKEINSVELDPSLAANSR
jgi:hypothetical protein